MSANLNSLLIDKNFIALDAKLKSGNIFRALNVADSETRHTRFLGYLLDPNETHGLSSAFLESFLLNLWRDTRLKLRISELDLDMASVFCEWSGEKGLDKNKIDILVKIPYKESKCGAYVIAIEAKVNAALSKNQLEKYSAKLDDAGFSNRTCIFLVKFEEQVDQQEWHTVFWQDLVLSSLETTRERYKAIVSPKWVQILDDYMEIISEWGIDEDPVVNDLCENLSVNGYKEAFKCELDIATYLEAKHRLAYKVLSNYFKSDLRVEIKKAFELWKDNKNLIVADCVKKYLRFYPSSKTYPFSVDLYSKTNKWVSQHFPLLFEIELSDKNGKFEARLILTMGPLDATYNSERKALVRELRLKLENNSDWVPTTREMKDDFTRVVSFVGANRVEKGSEAQLFESYLTEAYKIADVVNEVVSRSFLAKK